MTNNISHDSPCFLGFPPDKHLPKADVGLLVDVDVPWFPSDVKPNASTFWAHIDVDILKPASPMWTFPGNLRMQGNSARILEQVLEELKGEGDAGIQAGGAARVARLTAERDARLDRAKKLAADKGKPRRDQSALSVRRARQAARRPTTSSSTRRPQRGRGADADRPRRCPARSCASAAAGSARPAAWRSAPSSRRPTG